MSEEILENMVEQVMRQGGQTVAFGWQGGEPTLMGLDFFRKAVEFQKKYGRDGQAVGNGFQTNGILITKEWADFFRTYKFLIGLSLDGPEHIHDHYRWLKGNLPSWKKVAQARDILLNNGVEVNALIVVNDYSVNYPAEIYEYHKKNGLTFMQFIPCYENDPENGNQPTDFTVSAEKYGKFLCELFDLWIGDFQRGKPATSIRWFESLFYIYVNQIPPECTLLQECGIYVVIEHDGSVYSCDFFVEEQWKLGNVKEGRLIDLLNSPKQNEFGLIKKQVPDECAKCSWLKYCRCGCPKERFLPEGLNSPNFLCRAYKQFFEHAHSKFIQLANQWIKEQMIHHDQVVVNQKEHSVYKNISRNQLCPCGSGKKFKHCCGKIV